jgi:uncharacterized membrane protein HdeD (DUF308 family)
MPAHERPVRTVRRFEEAVAGESFAQPSTSREMSMIILGLVLLVLGLIADVQILTFVGVVLLLVGAVLALLGTAGRTFRGRRHFW